MTLNAQYNKWKENTLKKSLDKFKERKERFQYSSGVEVPRLALPLGFDTDGGLDTADDHRLLDHQSYPFNPISNCHSHQTQRTGYTPLPSDTHLGRQNRNCTRPKIPSAVP